MNNLALFDFDGTITNSDSFSAFALSLLEPSRRLIGQVIAAPSYVGYKMGWLSGNYLRKKVIKTVFTDLDQHWVDEQGELFARTYLPRIMNPFAVQRLALHKAYGDKIMIVSASLENYLRPWCLQFGFDYVCNRLEVKDGKYTGNIAGNDCAGQEKVVRILSRYDLSQFDHISAYGDTHEDWPMLSLAHTQYMGQDKMEPNI